MNNTKRRIHDGIVGSVDRPWRRLGLWLPLCLVTRTRCHRHHLNPERIHRVSPVYVLLDKTGAPETEADLHGVQSKRPGSMRQPAQRNSRAGAIARLFEILELQESGRFVRGGI